MSTENHGWDHSHGYNVGTRWRHPILGTGEIVSANKNEVEVLYDGGANVIYPAPGQFLAEGHRREIVD